MSKYEELTLILQFATIIVGAITLVLYYRQLRLLSAQLQRMQDSTKAQSALALVEHLQSPDTRAARSAVRGVLSKKAVADWTSDERSSAALVVSNYDVAAALIKSGVAPFDLIADNWGPSIVHCHEILKPFVAEVRSRPGGCQSYWSNFDWLADQTCKRAAKLI